MGDFKNNNANSTDYTYWQDGSLKTDLNKGISQIDYDAFLQKPKQINFSDGRRINFYYDTQGQKLKQTTSICDETHYATKAVYQRKNAVTLLYQISQAEGRELPFGSAYIQEYEYRDLVGNLRLSFKDATIGSPAIRNAPTIVQAVEYDPWGLELNGLGYESTVSPSKFKFSGKETINDFNLGWIDFGARMYDRQIGRWSAVDPSYENGGQESFTPYGYVFNNPIRYKDPDGRFPIGAAIGFVVGGAIEAGGQMLSGKSFKEIDWADVGVESVKGAIAGSGAGLIAIVGAEVGGAIIKGGIDISIIDGNKNVVNGKKSVSEASFDAATDFVAGRVGGAVAGKLGNVTENFVKKMVANSNAANQALSIAKNAAKEAPKNAGYAN